MEIANIKNKLAEAMGEPISKLNSKSAIRIIETMTALFAEINGADITAVAMVQNRKLNESTQRLRREAKDAMQKAEQARDDAQKFRNEAEKVRVETEVLAKRLEEILNFETAEARDRARLAEIFKSNFYQDKMNSYERQKYIVALGNILSGKIDGGEDDD